MTDLETIKALLDNVCTAYGINVPEYASARDGLDVLSVSENYAVAMFTFDKDGTLVNFEVDS